MTTSSRARLTRRRLLQGGAALGGLAAGSGALGGFPTIWAQNIKDITLRHAGPPVAAIPKIAEQATKVWKPISAASRKACGTRSIILPG
jgi:putative spermidine/putrescine transport system substrate-binding protein